MTPEEKLRLLHISEACALIAEYVNGVSKETFLQDTLRQDAVIRRIQIIGEAVRHLSHELIGDMPDFSARQARGMRNVLVHNYDAVNAERVWDTAKFDIPILGKSVGTYLQKAGGGVNQQELESRRPPEGEDDPGRSLRT
jgi:uncharacterized protein with HEPN domain